MIVLAIDANVQYRDTGLRKTSTSPEKNFVKTDSSEFCFSFKTLLI